MASCECCGSYENMAQRHARAQAEFYDYFSAEYTDATRELQRLQRLFTDLSWYNFELECRLWKHPWPQSVGSSMVTLCGARHAGRFNSAWPVYYSGRLDEAPSVPANILFTEIQLAEQWVAECQKRCDDVYDCAPGGREHELLVMKYNGRVTLY